MPETAEDPAPPSSASLVVDMEKRAAVWVKDNTSCTMKDLAANKRKGKGQGPKGKGVILDKGKGKCAASIKRAHPALKSKGTKQGGRKVVEDESDAEGSDKDSLGWEQESAGDSEEGEDEEDEEGDETYTFKTRRLFKEQDALLAACQQKGKKGD